MTDTAALRDAFRRDKAALLESLSTGPMPARNLQRALRQLSALVDLLQLPVDFEEKLDRTRDVGRQPQRRTQRKNGRRRALRRRAAIGQQLAAAGIALICRLRSHPILTGAWSWQD